MASGRAQLSLLHMQIVLGSLWITTTIAQANNTTSFGPQIGQPCFVNLNCTTPNTACMGYICDCHPGLVYDKVLGKCMQAVGGKCTNNEDCASNAHCDTDLDSGTSTCACNEPQYSVHRGIGKCLLNYGQICGDVDTGTGVISGSADFESCHPLKYLKCRPASDVMKCGCTEFGQVYDEHLGICVAKPGEVCDLFEYDKLNFPKLRCVSNAYCAMTPNFSDEEDDDYQVARCKCKPGYISVSNENCQPGHGLQCDLDMVNSVPELTCAPNMNLECKPDLNNGNGTSMGKCACTPGSVLVSSNSESESAGQVAPLDPYKFEYAADEAYEEYEDYDFTSTSSCVRVLLNAEFCNPSRDICTPHSACVENAEFYSLYSGKTFTTSTCQCLPGFSSTLDGLCKSGHGSSCVAMDSGPEECNDSLGLACVNHTCQCSTSTSTTFNGTNCVVFEGGYCSSDEPMMDCINNAICDQSSNICRCAESYSVDQTMGHHQCYPVTVFANCDPVHSPCLPATGLTCVDGVCICGDKQDNAHPLAFRTKEFDVTSGKCVEIRNLGHKPNSQFTANGGGGFQLNSSLLLILITNFVFYTLLINLCRQVIFQ